MLRFAVLLLQATLFLGTLLFRPPFLNLFDLPGFFEVTRVYGDKEIASCNKGESQNATIKNGTCALNKENGNSEYHSYQDKKITEFKSSHGAKGFGLSQT